MEADSISTFFFFFCPGRGHSTAFLNSEAGASCLDWLTRALVGLLEPQPRSSDYRLFRSRVRAISN